LANPSNRLVLIEWLDSCSGNHWNTDPPVTEPARVRTVGWVVAEGELAITIAASVVNDPVPQRCGEMTIPHCAIKSIVEIPTGEDGMPKGTKVDRIYKAILKKGGSKSSAAKIAQAVTGKSLATGRKPKKKGKKK
jgi:hypothetical protein